MSDERRELHEAASSAPKEETAEDPLSVWGANIIDALPEPRITASFSLADGENADAHELSGEDRLKLENALLKARLACMEFANFEFVANLATRKLVWGRPYGLCDDFVISRNVTKESIDQLIHELRKMRHHVPKTFFEEKVRELFMQGPCIRPYWQEEHVDDFQMTLDRVRRVQSWVSFNFGASVLRPFSVRDEAGWRSSDESEEESESELSAGDPMRARDGLVSRWRKDIGKGPWWGLLRPHQEWYKAEPSAPCQEQTNGQP